MVLFSWEAPGGQVLPASVSFLDDPVVPQADPGFHNEIWSCYDPGDDDGKEALGFEPQRFR
jgi:hypothetical protein